MRSRRRARPLPRPLAGIGLLPAGCAWDGPRSTLVGDSDLAGAILGVYQVIGWAALGIALVVVVVLAWVLVRFRERPGQPAPRQVRGHTLLEVGWTIAPALVLLVIAVPTVQVTFRTQGRPVADALEVEVRGWQWWWEFRYPGLGVVTANELHLPAGRPVRLRLEGGDVIHSFWVPRLGGKRDVIPGRTGWLAFTPGTAGEYLGQCAEFCGTAHGQMGLRVVVEPPPAFAQWVAALRAPAPEPPAEVAEGRAIFTATACVGCHAVRGVSAGALGPDLTAYGRRRMLAAGLRPNTPDNLAAWIRDPAAIKPGAKMPALGLTEAQARAVAAWLLSLR